MSIKLSPTAHAVLQSIRNYAELQGKPPTNQQIADEFSISRQAVNQQVQRLRKCGALQTGTRKIVLSDSQVPGCGELKSFASDASTPEPAEVDPGAVA